MKNVSVKSTKHSNNRDTNIEKINHLYILENFQNYFMEKNRSSKDKNQILSQVIVQSNNSTKSKEIDKEKLNRLLLSPRSEKLANSNELFLPPQKGKNVGRKTLVLDLDETLVHSSFTPINDVDIVLPVK